MLTIGVNRKCQFLIHIPLIRDNQLSKLYQWNMKFLRYEEVTCVTTKAQKPGGERKRMKLWGFFCDMWTSRLSLEVDGCKLKKNYTINLEVPLKLQRNKKIE